MAQWANPKKFVNPTRLYIIYGKSGGLHLVELGLTAGRQLGSMSDKIWARYGILKVFCRLKYSISRLDTALFDAFLVLFSGKRFYKVVI